MARLLIVHHTPSPTMHTLLEAVRSGTEADGIEGVDVVSSPALATTASDVLAADAIVIGTTANLGYISGALKHFFDTVYYPCLDATAGLPFGAYVHGNDDTTGAVAAIDKITTGLGWKQVTEHVALTGDPVGADRDACWNLGAVAAAAAMDG